MRLCGISSRFQLLSPGMGQVAHALLTRPPLSHRIFISEENQIKCFVRLACVKHAASVHPEPGSNSHVLKLFSKKMTSLCEPIRVADFKCEHIPFPNGLPSSFEYPVQLKLAFAVNPWLIAHSDKSEFTVLRLLHFWSVLELFSKSFKVFHCSVFNVLHFFFVVYLSATTS